VVPERPAEHDDEPLDGAHRRGTVELRPPAGGAGFRTAQQVAKDPYNFEFLGLSGEVAERELEQALTSRITETLRELGPGFAFVGRQVHFDVDGDDYYVDMLFFHIDQARYVVIELKTGKFQPEYAGYAQRDVMPKSSFVLAC
jgi:predicted nuclease of restriction endonuclease-like (RecB) superfamily